MSGIEIKSHREPDETITFDHGSLDLMRVGALTIGREVLDPGWHWATHVQPIVGTDRCEFHHVSYALSGRLAIESRDGELREVVTGDVCDIAPGHDAWVLGDEPYIAIDFQGAEDFAKKPEAGERVLTTMLFTDIVGSTAEAERLGDRPWKRALTPPPGPPGAPAYRPAQDRIPHAPTAPRSTPERGCRLASGQLPG